MITGSMSLLVMIISITPMQAVTPSSWTMGISIIMITANPRAFISKAREPGMKILQNARRAASLELLPASTSCFQALVICTAWDTPMEKIRNGTRIDIGSMPNPNSGNNPSVQPFGHVAHQFGEADNVYLDVRAVVLAANFFKALGDFNIGYRLEEV